MPKSKLTTATLATYLHDHGFSGPIPLNSQAKNSRAIKQLLRGNRFYTFGFTVIEEAIRHHQLRAKEIRQLMVKAAGDEARGWPRRGPGYFDPKKSARVLMAAIAEIKAAAQAKQRLIFATGHPGAMTGFYQELAEWAKGLGANVVIIEEPLPAYDRYYLDIIGSVLVPSDNCSAWHSHDSDYLEALLASTTADLVDLVVADHGFAAAAANHGLRTIGVYDTDDAALPLAACLGAPLLAIPINDNQYNARSAALARFLIQRS